MLKKKKEYRLSILTTIILSCISAIIGIGGCYFCIFLSQNIDIVLWFSIVGLSVFLLFLSLNVLSIWIPPILYYRKVIGIKKLLKTTLNSKNDIVIFRTLVISILVQIVVIILAALSLFF